MRGLAVACTVIFFSALAAADMPTASLVKACKEKTQAVEVIEGKAQVVGEKLNELCHGYLLGIYEVMIRGTMICAPAEPATPDYLLSVVQTYLVANPSEADAAAVQVTEAAYRRAFPCDAQRKKEWGVP